MKFTKAEAKEVKTWEADLGKNEPPLWETERAAAIVSLGTLDDGGWNALREVLRRGGFAKLYEGA